MSESGNHENNTQNGCTQSGNNQKRKTRVAKISSKDYVFIAK